MPFLSNVESLSSYLPELMLVLSILCVFIMESIPSYRHLTFIATCVGLIFTGILSIGLGFTLQTFAQRYAPSSHVAVVLSMESVFAAFAAFFILGQVLKISSLIGSIFIIIGVLISQFMNLKNKKFTRNT